MPVMTFRKDPDSVIDFGFDWEAAAADGGPYLESGETISTSTWTVAIGITKDSDSKGTTTTLIWLSGGTAGTTYRIANKIVTSEGRTAERSFDVIVENR